MTSVTRRCNNIDQNSLIKRDTFSIVEQELDASIGNRLLKYIQSLNFIPKSQKSDGYIGMILRADSMSIFATKTNQDHFSR